MEGRVQHALAPTLFVPLRSLVFLSPSSLRSLCSSLSPSPSPLSSLSLSLLSLSLSLATNRVCLAPQAPSSCLTITIALCARCSRADCCAGHGCKEKIYCLQTYSPSHRLNEPEAVYVTVYGLHKQSKYDSTSVVYYSKSSFEGESHIKSTTGFLSIHYVMCIKYKRF